jgi:hypothetical protein
MSPGSLGQDGGGSGLWLLAQCFNLSPTAASNKALDSVFLGP